MNHYSNDNDFQGRPLMQGGGGDYGPPGNYGPPGGYDQQGHYGNYQQQGGYPSTQYGQPPTSYQLPQTQYQQGGGYPPQGGGHGAGDPGAPKSMSATTTSMSLVFFTAACCVMLGALVAGIAFLIEWNIMDFLEMSYLLVLGAILAVLDTPFFKQIKAMGDLKMYIGKYLNVLMRVTGKGVGFIFLGCSLFTGIWNSHDKDLQNRSVGDMLLSFMAVVFCLIPVFVGFCAIVVGVLKSLKLSRAQDKLKEQYAQGALVPRLDQWAQTYRGDRCALTPLEFNRLTEETASLKWEDADLKLIFNALVSNPQWRGTSAAPSGNSGGRQADEPKIPKEDLINWVTGGMVWL